MNSIHTEKPDRILSEESRVSIHRIFETVKYAFIGAILALSTFAIISMFDMGSVTLYLGSTLVDPEAVWAFLGSVAGLVIGLVITSFSVKN